MRILEKRFGGRHFWARGYMAVSSGTITDEAIQKYIEDQEGESVADESRFQIDSTIKATDFKSVAFIVVYSEKRKRTQ